MSAREPEPEETLVVRKDNRLIDAEYNLTLQSLRVFALAIHKLRVHQRTVTFHADEFVELVAGREDTKGIYADLRAVAEEIVTAKVSLPEQRRGSKNPTWTVTTLAASAKLRADGVFQLEFSDELLPYLFHIQANYTPLELAVLMSLTSRHALRLYEVTRSWVGLRDKKTGRHRGIRFALEDIYKLLGIKDGEYELYGHFKNRVLTPACKQIEEKSDLRFRRSKKDGYFDELKDGKRVAAVRFTIESAPLSLPGMEALARLPDKRVKPKKTPAKPTPEADPGPELPLSGVVSTFDLMRESRRTKKPFAFVAAQAQADAEERARAEAKERAQAEAEEEARARVHALREALDVAERVRPVDKDMLRTCSEELLHAQHELHEIMARDQQPPEPEDDPREQSATPTE